MLTMLLWGIDFGYRESKLIKHKKTALDFSKTVCLVAGTGLEPVTFGL